MKEITLKTKTCPFIKNKEFSILAKKIEQKTKKKKQKWTNEEKQQQINKY